MSKKTCFDYIIEFVEALDNISDDERVTGYLEYLKVLDKSIDPSLTNEDSEKIRKHKRTTKKKYVRIFHGLYEEQSEPIIEEDFDWILHGVVIPSTRSDLFIDLTHIYMNCDLDGKLNILKYLYIICISLEDDNDIKETLKDIYKQLSVEKIKHHNTTPAPSTNTEIKETGNPLADMFNHMTNNMPQPEDPSKPDIAQMLGFVTHMMGDPTMQKNIEKLTQQVNTPDGLNNLFSGMQETLSGIMKQPQTNDESTENAPLEAETPKTKKSKRRPQTKTE